MSLIVSDNSPLSLLIGLGLDHVLPSLFGQVRVTPLVIAEMKHARAPDSVRAFANGPPPWLVTQRPFHSLSFRSLHPGESEAISLAVELGATILIDEAEGRGVARTLGLDVIGAVGVLERAAIRGLIADLDETFRRLPSNRFRISAEILNDSLARWRKAKSDACG